MRTISPQIMTDGIKVDTILRQQRFVLPKPIYKIPLVKPLLPTSRWLRRNHSALHTGFDAVGTWLVLVTADLALLTMHAAGASCEFDHGWIERLMLRVLGMLLRLGCQAGACGTGPGPGRLMRHLGVSVIYPPDIRAQLVKLVR